MMTSKGHLFACAFRAARPLSAGIALFVPLIATTSIAQGQGAQPAAAAAQQNNAIIRQIQVQGTQRVEAETVTAYMQLKPGDRYDPLAADNSVKILFATGLFEDVRLNWDGTTLTVNVVENPIINQVVLEGNNKLTTSDITKEVQIKPRSVFTRSKVTEDVNRIIELYRRAGRFGATVEPKIIQRPQNRVDLVFEIREGEPTGIARISFIGNKVFDDSDLRDEIVTKESTWWRIFSSSDNYDPDRLTFDREQLRRFYLRNGYADFRVLSAVAELVPDRSDFFVTFTVDEGRQYRFGKISIDSQIKDLDPKKLMPLLTVDEGDIYNSQAVDKSVEALTYAAGTQGFVFTDIRPRINRDPQKGTIDVVFNIAPGPRVYVEKINIVGNSRTMDKVIRREIRLSEGDAFNRVLIDRSRTRIRALGFFKKVEIKQEPGSEPDRTVVTVNVTEQPTGQISLGVGYSSQDSFLADFSYTETNLFGRGQYLRAGISMSSYQKDFDLRFTEPYFLDRSLSAGVQLYRLQTDLSTEAGYISTTSAAGLVLGFPLSEYSRFSPRYTLRLDELAASYNSSSYILYTNPKSTTSMIGYTYAYDDRDDPQKPTKGRVFSFSQDIAGLGGQLRYVRTEATADFYHQLWIDGLVARISLKAGYIFGYDGQQVAINERFFKGGESFRGFNIAGIGPRMDVKQVDSLTGASYGYTQALGGQFYNIASFEARLPSVLPENYGITFSLFTDVGTLGIVKDISKKCQLTVSGTITTQSCMIGDNLKPRASVGIAVGWKSPFGPVEIDLAYPFLKQPDDKTQSLRFSAGTQF